MNGSMKWVLCTLLVGLGAADTFAQQPPPPGFGQSRSPSFSPYLNLLRGGNSPTLNYYGLVRPEQNFRQSLQNMQGQLFNNQQSISELERGGLTDIGTQSSVTGHNISFMNLGGYFMNYGGSLSSLSGASATTGGIGRFTQMGAGGIGGRNFGTGGMGNRNSGFGSAPSIPRLSSGGIR